MPGIELFIDAVNTVVVFINSKLLIIPNKTATATAPLRQVFQHIFNIHYGYINHNFSFECILYLMYIRDMVNI